MIKEILDLVPPFFDSAPAIRAILGLIVVFFLPGFTWTLVFFSNERQINVVERLALSFGLSIAIVTLSIPALNILLRVSITGTNAVLVILAITIIPAVWYCLKRIIKKHFRLGILDRHRDILIIRWRGENI